MNQKYKPKGKMDKRSSCFIRMPDTAEKSSGYNSKLTLYQNQTDESNTFVVIKFYLPLPSDVSLILMDSNKKEVLCLIEKNFEAGDHTFVTDLTNEELEFFDYFCKLQTKRHTQIRRMKHIDAK